MKDPVRTRTPWALHEIVGGAASLIALTVFTLYACQRVFYLFAITPSEGIVLEHVQRLLESRPLYVRPSLDWVPLLYTPLYYYASKLLVPVLGEGFGPLRVVSLVSTFGSMLLIGAFVRRETGKLRLGVLGAGFFSAMYVLTLEWYDTARVDMLALLFLLASLYTLRFGSGLRASALTALFFAFSFLTKQTALVALPAMILFSVYRDRTRSLYFVVPTLVSVGLIVAVAHWMTDGWFTYYVVTLPSLQPRPGRFIFGIASNFLSSLFPLLILIAAGACLGLSNRGKAFRTALVFYAALLSTLGASATISSMKIGGDVNHFIPFLALAAILSATTIDWIARATGNLVRPRFATIGLALLILLQFFNFNYPSLASVPSQEAQKAFNESRLRTLRELPGDLFFIHSDNYLARLVGKRRFANSIAITDILWTAPNEYATALLSELRRGIESQAFGGVVLNLGVGHDAYLVRLSGDLSNRTQPGLLRTVLNHYKPVSSFRPEKGIEPTHHQFTAYGKLGNEGKK